MNFQNLEYFLAVARENNITKAAEQLGITQQALSNQISRMEDELGCRLFNRKHGFQLTAAGKEMLKSSKRILDIYDQTQLVMNDISENKRGELRIGVTHSRGQYILPVLLPDFARMYPNVSLSLTEGSTRLLEKFENLRIQVLVAAYTDKARGHLANQSCIQHFPGGVYTSAQHSVRSNRYHQSLFLCKCDQFTRLGKIRCKYLFGIYMLTCL